MDARHEETSQRNGNLLTSLEVMIMFSLEQSIKPIYEDRVWRSFLAFICIYPKLFDARHGIISSVRRQESFLSAGDSSLKSNEIFQFPCSDYPALVHKAPPPRVTDLRIITLDPPQVSTD